MGKRGRQLSQSGHSEKEAEVGLWQDQEPNNAGDLERVER